MDNMFLINSHDNNYPYISINFILIFENVKDCNLYSVNEFTLKDNLFIIIKENLLVILNYNYIL